MACNRRAVCTIVLVSPEDQLQVAFAHPRHRGVTIFGIGSRCVRRPDTISAIIASSRRRAPSVSANNDANCPRPETFEIGKLRHIDRTHVPTIPKGCITVLSIDRTGQLTGVLVAGDVLLYRVEGFGEMLATVSLATKTPLSRAVVGGRCRVVRSAFNNARHVRGTDGSPRSSGSSLQSLWA